MSTTDHLPELPAHMQMRPESPVALSSESITAMLQSYGRQCYEAGVAAESARPRFESVFTNPQRDAARKMEPVHCSMTRGPLR